MSRTPHDRWDLGEEPLDGAWHPITGDYYGGTNFAIRYDRRWELIATWPSLIGAAATVANKQDEMALAQKSKATRSRAYREALAKAKCVLIDFARYPSALTDTHLLRNKWGEPFRPDGLFQTIDGLLTERFNFTPLRPLWLFEGYLRYHGDPPESIEQIEEAEEVRFPPHERASLNRELCVLASKWI